jgi:hypothetical protein
LIEMKNPARTSGRVFKFGGATFTIDEPMYPPDVIPISSRLKTRIIDTCRPLRERGLSLREIANQTGIPKTSIADALRREDRRQRLKENLANMKPRKAKGRAPGRPPFGYGYLDGKLVKDPNEFQDRPTNLATKGRRKKLWCHRAGIE